MKLLILVRWRRIWGLEIGLGWELGIRDLVLMYVLVFRVGFCVSECGDGGWGGNEGSSLMLFGGRSWAAV